jgi:hypothetical protein
MPRRIALGIAPLALAGCAWLGGGDALAPGHCEIRVVGVEQWRVSPEGADVSYRVRGKAGSPGETWLVAQNPTGSYVPGLGVDVGPGPFEAIVDLQLTGLPRRFFALLQVAGRRCKANAPIPD